jgi:hypothetical protein
MVKSYFKQEQDMLFEILQRNPSTPSNPALQSFQTARLNQTIGETGQQSLRNVGNGSIGTILNDATRYPVLVQYPEMKQKYENDGIKVRIQHGNPNGTPSITNVLKFTQQLNTKYIILKKNKFTDNDSLRNFPNLKTLGYTTGGELGSGGDITSDLLNALVRLQTILQKPKYNPITPITITGGNDLYHHNEDKKDGYSSNPSKSTHTRGIAIDIGAFESYLGPKNLLVEEALREAGFAYVLFHNRKGYHTHANLAIN